ncbi:MAG TPA: hypothetical protein VJB59_16150 [Bdellovibrionota bacterium]|nr:hypothetical protein [Bdellovibrionota bacterium]
MNITVRAALAWLGLFVLAFVNGAIRELGMKTALGIGEPLAHQLSSLTGIALWTAFVLLVWSKLRINSFKKAILVGAGWFVATVLVETFVINRNLSWNEVLQTYNVAAGEFWGLVLIWIGLMPVVIYRVKKS